MTKHFGWAVRGCASVLALAAGAAGAQTVDAGAGVEEIIVTAQRQAQSLQDVPIAVSAFSAEALQRQQIENSLDLQLTLPNITFTKTNFTGSSFTIRGIGDLCVGVTCDQATGIAVNELPVFSTRLFETEYFDLERIEVLRGPQGTLFGRNATSGVVNLVTAKPDLAGFAANASFDYGNYDSILGRAMVNLPLSDRFGVRVAGLYLQRDGYTRNVFLNTDVDDRKLWAVRGSVRWDLGENTRVDAMAYYFRENDGRSRIQKQLCQRDPTGVLGCLPGRRDFGILNANSTFVGVLSSREFLRIAGGPALGPVLQNVGLGSVYGPDAYANFVNPPDVRQVATDFAPEYFAEEEQYMARIEHDFGPLKARVSGIYQASTVDSREDYNLSVQDPTGYRPGLAAMQALAAGPLPQFRPVIAALFPNGVGGPSCTSETETSGTGAYGGRRLCSATPQDFDRSVQTNRSWTVEGILESQYDGRFNFLLGAIYSDYHLTENSYYVNAFGIDYIAGVLGVAQSLGAGLPNSFLATPFFRNNTDDYRLHSYGIFGEVYLDLTDRLRFTGGVRYNNDLKKVRARSTLASFLAPFGIADAFASPFVGAYDADPGRPGNQLWQERRARFDAVTGRAVLDWRVTPDTLIYVSYARGYKSGGINPPLQPVFEVPESFTPEFIDAFEVGTKNSFLDGTLQANLTAFYYKYRDLQLSRIVARTSVNDNVSANIWGIEGEFVFNPIPPLVVNLNVSFLNTRVSEDKFLSNPRDPSGGRADAVIIKDLSNGSNCAVVPRVAGSNAAAVHVGVVNSVLGLRPATAFPADSGLNGALGAFGICAQLQNPAFPTTPAVEVLTAGVPVNIRGNELPQAPDFKFAVGAQYTFEFAQGWSFVPRVDYAFTGESFGNIFNGFVNRVPSYGVVNLQAQLNAPDRRWFVRGYVQNLTDNNAVTGLYVTDQSSGLFTNIFTLEPRRYGVAVGVNF
ncbi:MAG: TonB-dependent receptor [Thermaurantiacus sp.]|uniref:TonB-dependent receptor n=1 Tax=Thermaurantiacus sp. TaxID=2820283 RepID=UPI00298F0194|nr:TonB-dependent receptor [Thermaurantiacus sp.]MDW8415326.1 TonB-dependent receptor [Thermaurantiacus sp.]